MRNLPIASARSSPKESFVHPIALGHEIIKQRIGLAATATAPVDVAVTLASAQERREARDQNKGKQKIESDSRESATQTGRDQGPRVGCLEDGQCAFV